MSAAQSSNTERSGMIAELIYVTVLYSCIQWEGQEGSLSTFTTNLYKLHYISTRLSRDWSHLAEILVLLDTASSSEKQIYSDHAAANIKIQH